MARSSILSILMFFCVVFSVVAQNACYFPVDGAIRVDFSIAGNRDTAIVCIEQLKLAKAHSGFKEQEIDTKNYGNFRIRLLDEQNNTIIFSKGFSSLFEEWQSTNEATIQNQSFYHCMYVPLLSQKTTLQIQKRSKKGVYYTLFDTELNPKSISIINENPTPYRAKKIIDNGCSSKKIDILFLPEGYQKEEMEKFESDITNLCEELFKLSPFKEYFNYFNIHAIFLESVDSGSDYPTEQEYNNTALNSSFNTFNSPRYLTTKEIKKIHDVAEQIPHDQIFVLVNTNRYGGGGIYNYLNICSANHPLSPSVFIHEFCHGFVGLADEYYNPNDIFGGIYNNSVEPWEPNITTLQNFASKWSNLVHDSVPVPTPRIKKYKDITGVFEGGGYQAKGIYSPAMDCRMKTIDAPNFCEICTKAIIDKILEFNQ